MDYFSLFFFCLNILIISCCGFYVVKEFNHLNVWNSFVMFLFWNITKLGFDCCVRKLWITLVNNLI